MNTRTTDLVFVAFLVTTVTGDFVELSKRGPTKFNSEVILPTSDNKLVHALRKEVIAILSIMEDSGNLLDKLSSMVGKTLTVSFWGEAL